MQSGDILSDALNEEQEALQLMRSGKLELARYRLAKLCRKYPQHAKFHFNYALVLYKLKRFDEALDEVNTGLWLKPDDSKATSFKKELLNRMAKSDHTETTQQSRLESTSISPQSILTKKKTIEEQEKEIQLTSKDQPEITSEHIILTKEETIEEQEKESQLVSDNQLETTSESTILTKEEMIEEQEKESQLTSEDQPEASLEPTISGNEQLFTAPDVESTPMSIPESIDRQEILETHNVEINSDAFLEESGIVKKQRIQELETRSPPISADIANEELFPEPNESHDFPASFIKNLKLSLNSRTQNHDASTDVNSEIQENDKQEATPNQNISNDQDIPAIDSTEANREIETVSPSPENTQFPTQEHSSSGFDTIASDEPVVINESSELEIDSGPIEIIEVEPRVIILEKAADITMEHGELQESLRLSNSSEEDKEGFKIEEMQGPIVIDVYPEIENKDKERRGMTSEVPTSRLKNLKDLFKESKEKIMESCEAATPESEQQAILHNTVELEPFDESRLLTFKSLHELDGYKYAIQALVLKYLEKKVERESKEEPGISAATCLYTVSASIDEMENPLTQESGNEAEEIDLSNSLAEAMTATPQDIISTNLINNDLDKEILGALIDTTNGASEYLIPIDIKSGIAQKIYEKVRASENDIPSPMGDILAGIIDMQTYMENVRLNRNFIKNRQILVNDMLGNEITAILTKFESPMRPSQMYSLIKALQSETFDMDQQIERIESGDQLCFSETELNNILNMIRQIGKGLEKDTDNDDTSKMKENLARIKKITHLIYENAQYEQSITIYSALLNFFPEDFEILFNAGFCFRELGNYKEGEKIFKRIIELFYDNAYAWYNLALIYAFTAEGEKEAYCLQKARDFGYIVDIDRLSRLNLAYEPKNPFDFD